MEVVEYCNMLPEGCISAILSLTSPADACRSSLVSSAFRAATESDTVWERFLPSDYHEIVSRLVSPLKFSSKKELYLQLCNQLLIDGGKQIFKLERLSGRKSFILSARQLSITWSNDPTYWRWVPTPESRFSEMAVLIITWWLEIHGRISTHMLSPNTRYGAYLIMKITNRAYGLDSVPSEVSVEVGDELSSTGMASLSCSGACPGEMKDIEVQKLRVPSGRDDGWMEIELGEFFNGDAEHKEVKMSLMEVKNYQLKGGLMIDGIEVRPKH